MGVTSFNSTLVQLKEDTGIVERKRFLKFQFYLSSIKSGLQRQFLHCSHSFQFYLSSIKRYGATSFIVTSNSFQFYLSSIKSGCWIYSKNTIRKVSILP